MENDLNSVVDSLPGLVWTAQPDGQVDFLNRHWCAYTGLGVDEAHGSGWQLAIHPADRPGLLERWRSILAAGEAASMEARLRRFDGEYRWFQFCTRPLARSIRADRQVVWNRHRHRRPQAVRYGPARPRG